MPSVVPESGSASTRPPLNGNNATEIAHSREGDILLRATQAVTLVSLSLNKHYRAARLKVNETVSILQLMKMLWAMGQRVDGTLFFQGLKFK